ncbi:asparaginase-domain-containing protein [Leucogyrophana mollusca]|uniref:Asparaginase-domain-containing protein n=1 Tax=Leucogyrophana mollusca TaxID=85980 RepID=A0ACB8BND4_9AGAM|nr:asparaginase-domain-containing protein [Leucogyrophana mollusca]
MDHSQPSDESRVLVIYTGGTIGMLVSPQGYVPEPYFLTETLRSQNRFHDPLQDSLFSNAGSVEGYRVWSTSGRSSPTSPSSTTVPSGNAVPHHQPTLAVRSSRPIGISVTLAPTTQQVSKEQIECKKISDAIYEAHLPTLVTPRSIVPGQSSSKRIRYAILEWNPLLDSSNIEIDDWIRIATEIELNYTSFDAFVILHGTDTMSYSAGALSFLLEDLGKTVILTGAQIPLSQLRNDAVDNLLGALSIAGNYIIPECSLYFNHTLFRGNRVSKVSSYDLNAFHSPNFSPLVNVGIDIVVNWNDVIRQTSLRRFKAHKEMSPHVATLRLFPGITGATIRAFLMPPTRGVVLETFGAGNAPQRSDLMAALKDACDRGIVIVAITQCTKGSVSDAYETGRTLLQAGVVPGGDMTPECALTKLSYLLSKPELSVDQVRELVGTPLRGELTRRAVPAPSHPGSEGELPNIQGLLSQFVRLAGASSSTPRIVLSPSVGDTVAEHAAAPWSRTAAETASTEAALLPYLIHLASARDDMESMQYCLSAFANDDRDDRSVMAIPGGIVNCIEPGSGRSPLHVAALNNSIKCLNCLLESGALVHLRDSLGHTALYYAARQGHEDVVDILISAGANLGGVEYETGFATLALQNAMRSGHEGAFKIWAKTGMRMPQTEDTRPV